jgi:hypothetical protein
MALKRDKLRPFEHFWVQKWPFSCSVYQVTQVVLFGRFCDTSMTGYHQSQIWMSMTAAFWTDV